MEPQGDQQSGFTEARRGDGSFDVSSTEFRTLATEIGGSLNTATDALLGAFEPLRTHSETEPLLAPLDDILKDIYDIKSAFTPTSTASLSYPMVSNPNQAFLPNFTSPTRNLTYENLINNEISYEVPCPSYGTSYMPSTGQNFMPVPSSVVQMPMPVPMHPSQLVSLPEEDNDGPVYLNFNIGNIPPCVTPFQKYQQQPAFVAPFQKYQQQPPPAVNVGGIYPENNLRYMEYLNESGDTARARFFDNSAKGFREYRTYRQNTMNAMNKIQFGQPNIEGCSKYIYATEVNSEPVVSNETPIPAQNEENSFVVKQNLCESIKLTASPVERWTTENVKTQTITYSEEPNIVICRPPLRTKRSVRENSEISLQFSGGEGNEVGNVLGVEYIAVIDNTDVDIPTIQYGSPVGRMKRKQELKIRKWEDEVSFEEPNLPKCEVDGAPYEKLRISPVYRTPVNKKKPLSEEMFLGKRKRKSSTPPANRTTDDSDYRPFCGDLPTDRRKSRTTPTNRDSYRTRNSGRSERLLDCGSTHESSAGVIPSSDSDLEDMPVLSSKSLKCPKCKKIFKTPRSLAIHLKRCPVPAEVESDLEVTMVEYLESEKELDGADEVSLVETLEGTTSVTVIEKIDENTVDKTDEVKEEQRENEPQDQIQENPLRRNTRSLTNLIASRKLGQSNDPKPRNGQGKIKTASNKGTNVNSRSTRRKKGK